MSAQLEKYQGFHVSMVVHVQTPLAPTDAPAQMAGQDRTVNKVCLNISCVQINYIGTLLN